MNAVKTIRDLGISLEDFTGKIYVPSWERGNQSHVDTHSDYLTWEAALESLQDNLSSLTAQELDQVHNPRVDEIDWKNGNGLGSDFRKFDIKSWRFEVIEKSEKTGNGDWRTV